MKQKTADKIIGTLTFFGMFAILMLCISATVKYVAPALEHTFSGNILLYVIYGLEGLSLCVIFWFVTLIFKNLFSPKNKSHIKNIPLNSAKNITGKTHGIDD